MTATSQEVPTRAEQLTPPPPPGRSPLTFGRPTNHRQTAQRVATGVIVGLPLLAAVGIGATVVHSYNAHLRSETTQAAPKTASSPTQDVPDDSHAPTGPDVGTTGLSDQLTRAITRARTAAAAEGVTINIVSGYRSAANQQQLFDQAVRKYGSAAEASKWVLPPDKSDHVKGQAVDVGPYAAAKWLKANGVKFGLCQRYANEYWHFEVLAPAKDQPCPALEANASGQ